MSFIRFFKGPLIDERLRTTVSESHEVALFGFVQNSDLFFSVGICACVWFFNWLVPEFYWCFSVRYFLDGEPIWG